MTHEWPWSADLDALVAAPAHHTLLLENDEVRVLETRVTAGDRVPVHTHRWPSVSHVLSAGRFVRRDVSGGITHEGELPGVSATAAAVSWSGPLPPHSFENVGQSEIRVISVELKNSRMALRAGAS